MKQFSSLKYCPPTQEVTAKQPRVTAMIAQTRGLLWLWFIFLSFKEREKKTLETSIHLKAIFRAHNTDN